MLWKRIVGGTEAKFGQFPWEVSLRRIVGFISSHRCGAVLVHPRWVLTAAHCASEYGCSCTLIWLKRSGSTVSHLQHSYGQDGRAHWRI